MHLQYMPDILPYDTAFLSDTRKAFDLLRLHQIFGCCHFRNPKHITSSANNATLIDTGEPPITLGAFTTISKEIRVNKNSPIATS